MVETGPGTVKLANLPGTHDDIVTAVGMVVADLAGRSEPGPGTVTNPADSAVRIARTARGLGPRAAMGGHPLGVTRDGLRGASRNGSRGIAAILVPGSANEPGRRSGPRAAERHQRRGRTIGGSSHVLGNPPVADAAG